MFETQVPAEVDGYPEVHINCPSCVTIVLKIPTAPPATTINVTSVLFLRKLAIVLKYFLTVILSFLSSCSALALGGVGGWGELTMSQARMKPTSIRDGKAMLT